MDNKSDYEEEEEESFSLRGRRIIFVQRKKNHFRSDEQELPGDLRVNLYCSCNSGPRGPVELI